MTDKEGKINLEEFAKLEFQVRSLLQSGRFQAAGELLEKLRKIYRGFSPYLVLWGDYFRAKKDFKQAEKTYIKAIDLDIKNKNAYISLAMFYDESLKKYDKVDEVLWAGVYNSGDPLFFYYYLEMFHVNIGNEEKAIEVVKAVEKEYKDQGELYYKKAEAAYALGLFIDAIDLCRQSLDKGYTGTHHYFYLANCFAHVNLDLEAIDFLKKAIIKNPNNYSMYDKLFELNVHKIGTGDQDLKTAINIKLAIGAGSLKEKVNLLYLADEADYKYYLDYLDNYLKIDLYDLKLDYRAFCEFYKNLVIFKPDFKDKRIDLRTSFYQCLITNFIFCRYLC